MLLSLLEEIEPIIHHNRSAVVEGDIFSILAHSPYVIRANEFGLADGAVDCSRSYHPTSTYASRFWEFDQDSRTLESSHEVLLFDGKGAVFDQRYLSSVAQGKHIAFYIGLCTADPTFVELIPNYLQDSDDQPMIRLTKDQKRYLSVNSDRDSKMAFRTQGLNQTNAPFRMPLSMLKDAILRVRECAQGRGTYVNPWTLVAFPDWKPKTTTSSRFLKPLESTANFTAYEAAMEIYRTIQSQHHITGMLFDFVGLQPRVADFKIVETQAGKPVTTPDQNLRQVLVQHKLHNKLLSKANLFEKVNVVARRQAKHRQYYFSATNRFDYFFFQFMISDDSSPCHRTEFFFLPERVVPDSFYVSEDLELSFNRPDFLRYKIHMDDEGEWIFRVREVIQNELQPRKPGQRPLRPTSPIAGVEFELMMDVQLLDETDDFVEEQENKGGPSTMEHNDGGDDKHADSNHRLDSYVKAMKHTHTRFFHEVMLQCATRSSGLLIVLSSNHPAGDFAFCRYRWTAAERDDYLKHGRTPRAAHHLPATTPTVPICLYSRHAGCSFEGPDLKPAVFRRLDACSMPRIIAWDLPGPDSLQSMPPILIPSDDVSPSERQRQVFTKEAEAESDQHVYYTPVLSVLLSKGYLAGEYGVAKCGPLVYGNNVWDEMWKALEVFTGIETFQLPAGSVRQPSVYRHSLQALHQRLAEEFHHLTTTAK